MIELIGRQHFRRRIALELKVLPEYIAEVLSSGLEHFPCRSTLVETSAVPTAFRIASTEKAWVGREYVTYRIPTMRDIFNRFKEEWDKSSDQ